MKKIMYGALFLATMTTANAEIISNQTFVRSRDSLSHNAIMTTVGRMHTSGKKQNQGIGGTLSVAPYYRTSSNKSDIATALGGGQQVNGDQYGRITIEPGQSTSMEAEAYNLYSGAMDHLGASGTTGMSGTIALNPTRSESGAHISWQQKLPFIYKGLSLHIEMPIVQVIHDLGAAITGKAHATDAYGELNSTINTYFKGKGM